jgi:hypothetical protein
MSYQFIHIEDYGRVVIKQKRKRMMKNKKKKQKKIR